MFLKRAFFSLSAWTFKVSSNYCQHKRDWQIMSKDPSLVKKAKFCPGGIPGHDRLVWVDCEMTGLEVETDRILEIACLITDANLNIVAEGPNLIIHEPDEIMKQMNAWCIQHHGESGLTHAVKDSKISLQEAEMQVLSFVRQHTPPGRCPLAGNSIHADKRFLDKYMPHFMKHLHYRIVDVSTIKELCKRWHPDIYSQSPQKKATHRALEDIQESIKELQFYRNHLFVSGNQCSSTREVPHDNGRVL